MSMTQLAPRSRVRQAGRRLAHTGIALLLAGTGLAGVAAAPAQAVTGFHTSASSVRVRAAANTQSTQISTIAATGTAIDIACQASGESVTASGFGTSAVWDKLNGYGGGYISDLFVRETSYAQFDARIPRCEAPAPPAPTPTTSRETKAISWANGQIGHYTDDWGRPTSGWCARWAVGAYGRMNSGYGTAWAMFAAFQQMGLTHTGNAPAGTFVFFKSAAINGWAGHVAISDGAGGMITTSSTNIKHTALSYAGAPYVGWAYAPAGWTR